MPRCSARISTADGREASPLPDEAITGLLSTRTKNGMRDDRYDEESAILNEINMMGGCSNPA